MDDFDKNITAIIFLAIIAVVYVVSVSYLISHDEGILKSCRNDAKLQYFIESNNLTNQGKYDLAKSICNETFSNESLYDKLWCPKMPFWNIEGHKEHEINRCECALLGID